jgi:hypothetical protein
MHFSSWTKGVLPKQSSKPNNSYNSIRSGSAPMERWPTSIIHYAGRDEESLTTAAKALQPAPPMWVVGVAYEGKKDFPRAIAHLQEVTQAYQVSLAEADVAHAYAASGDTVQAKLILHRLLNISAKSYVSPYKVAAIYAGLGDQGQMFRWLRAACDEGDPWLVRLNIDPDFSLYRSRR